VDLRDKARSEERTMAALFNRLCLLALIPFCLNAYASHAVVRNAKAYGAIGDGTMDDSAAINAAIAALKPADELFFPCGTYKVTSALTPITVKGVTVDGQTGCSVGPVKIISSASGKFTAILQIGNGNLSSSTPLTAPAADLSTTFCANLSAISVGVGDYVLLQEGGRDYSTDTAPGHDTKCDISGCRGEILKIQAARGEVATVDTALHFPYDPGMNAAVVYKVLGVVDGTSIHDLILDGTGTVSLGLYLKGTTNSRVAKVTVQNVINDGLVTYYSYNLGFNGVTVTHAGNGGANGITLQYTGKPSINGATIQNLNNGAFGLGVHSSTDGTFTNVSVDKAGSGTGRPCKIHATSYSTFNTLTCKNETAGNYNGLILDYYSSFNTFKDCIITGNAGPGSSGIVTFGNSNQHNTFVNCTVSGNAVYQIAQGTSALGNHNDAFTTVYGGTYTGNSVLYGISLVSDNAYVSNVNFAGPGSHGLDIRGNNSCVTNNKFVNFSKDVVIKGVNNLGSGNTAPDGVIGLRTGVCP
jgi:hypothetical protein